MTLQDQILKRKLKKKVKQKLKIIEERKKVEPSKGNSFKSSDSFGLPGNPLQKSYFLMLFHVF